MSEVALADGDLRTSRSESLCGLLPSVVTLVRLMTTPLFVYAVARELRDASLVVFLFLLYTDVLDGYIARKLNVSSPLGAYFDAFADFLLVTAALLVFAAEGAYPAWTVLIVTAMFLQFLVTSRLKGPIYDPIGKYYGGALYAVVLLTLLFRDDLAHDVLLVLFLLYTAAVVASRYLFLADRRKDAGRSTGRSPAPIAPPQEEDGQADEHHQAAAEHRPEREGE